MKNNLKPFDLERALAGDPVVTRRGDKVIQILRFDDIEGNSYPYLLTALIKGDGGYYISHYTLKGKYPHLTDEHDVDLLMVPKTKKLWIGVMKQKAHDENNFYITTVAYEAFSDLVGNASAIHSFYYIKEIEIEV